MENYCKICNKTIIGSYASFTRSHLKNYHNISVKDYYDNYIKHDNEGKCECGNLTTFIDIKNGYRKSCSVKCAAINQERVSKIKNTKLIRYGDENYSNRLKSKETLLKKYGVENVSQIEEIKLKKINTCIKNYGVDNPLKNINIKDKMQNTMLSRYGHSNPSKIYEFQEIKKQTCLDKYGEDNYSKTSIYRKYNENKGIWIKTSDVKDFILYYRKVWAETRKFKKELFDKWNGRCHYTNEVLIDDKKQYNHENYRTIDHKISVYRGFIDNIDYKIIGNIDNLCICSRRINIIKNKLTEQEFKKLKLCRI